MDVCDIASEKETLEREVALKNIRAARFKDMEKPLIIDGVRCCLDCEEPIPEERLRIKPDAVRCVFCQDRRERQ